MVREYANLEILIGVRLVGTLETLGLRHPLPGVLVRGASLEEKATLPVLEEERFALRSVSYTIVFLGLVLGVIPSLFYLAGERMLGSTLSTATILAQFCGDMQTLLGASIFCIGLGVYIFCSAWLILYGRGPHVEFDPPKVFVATGPYRYVRNPVAISLVITGAGQAIYFSSLALAILVGLGIVFAHYQATRIEEPRLRLRFGKVYEDYCRKVPRWLPRPPDRDIAETGPVVK
jgi:protein-S-isoprenylcysteine O-methyltransferase Ste14